MCHVTQCEDEPERALFSWMLANSSLYTVWLDGPTEMPMLFVLIIQDGLRLTE